MKSISLVFAVWVVGAGNVFGHPHPPQRLGVEMELIVNGRSIGGASGASTVYVPVRDLGREYVLRIHNRLAIPIEAVVSVDGLSVINGQRASESIRGYMVQPHASVDIPGWRRGNRKVAAFTFSREEDSYAYRTGRPDGIGVIRLVAFEQARPIRPLATREFGSDERAAPKASPVAGREVSRSDRGGGLGRRVANVERIGTGYGRDVDHHVSRVPFQRSRRTHRVTVHYGSAVRYVPLADDFTPPPPRR